MAIPGFTGGALGAAATSDKGKRFLSGFTDFLTGGRTDLDQKGDSRLQEFQKNQMRRNVEGVQGFGDILTGGLTDFDKKGDSGLQQFGKKATGVFGQAMLGGTGSLAKNAMDLVGINGTTDSMGLPSQGAQELSQKVEQNEKSGLQQRTANLFRNINPYQELMRDTTVEDPNTGKRINKDLLDLLNNRPDLRKRMDETGSIFSEM